LTMCRLTVSDFIRRVTLLSFDINFCDEVNAHFETILKLERLADYF